MFRQQLFVDAGLVVKAFREAGGYKLDQVVVAGQIFAEQDEVIVGLSGSAVAVMAATGGNIDLTAENGFYSVLVRRIVEFVEATPNCTRRLILENLAGLEHVEPKEGETPPPTLEQTEEQKQLISDLHWLIHQGHVLDFANGVIETAKKPRPKEEKKKESMGEVSSVEKDAPAETKSVVEEAPKAITSEDSVPEKTTDE